MYNKLFSEEIGQLNSIVFVVKSTENRENEYNNNNSKNINFVGGQNNYFNEPPDKI